jgi:hypothetical protein
MIGFKIGKLEIISNAESYILPSGQKNKAFLCKCECGNEKKVRWLHLKRGKIQSCGCYVKTRNGIGNSPICKLWRGIKYRTSENYFQRHLYFDKGIKVSENWLNNFDEFYNWCIENGYKKGLQLDRKNNSLGYFPENCRFVTSKINCNNRDNTFYVFYNNEKIALKILLEKLRKEKNYFTILARIKRGWEHQKAIDTEIKQWKK